MNWNRFILSGAAAFVVMFVMGFVWHVPLFGAYYAEQASALLKAEMVLPVIILAEVIRAFVLAYVYPLGYKGGAPLVEGGRFGLMMGLFTAMLPLIYVSRYNYTSFNWFWVEGLFFLIQGAAAGIIIAYIHGGGSNK
ncbi:MAG: DUF1761 domain-containing protein [SAR324 cluster bacterium]|nr:DUF1761 domain-containing protein [SAR324 cluster bacterium]